MCASHFKLARKEWVYTCCNANSIAKSGNHYGIEKKVFESPLSHGMTTYMQTSQTETRWLTLFRRRFKYHIDNILWILKTFDYLFNLHTIQFIAGPETYAFRTSRSSRNVLLQRPSQALQFYLHQPSKRMHSWQYEILSKCHKKGSTQVPDTKVQAVDWMDGLLCLKFLMKLSKSFSDWYCYNSI